MYQNVGMDPEILLCVHIYTLCAKENVLLRSVRFYEV